MSNLNVIALIDVLYGLVDTLCSFMYLLTAVIVHLHHIVDILWAVETAMLHIASIVV